VKPKIYDPTYSEVDACIASMEQKEAMRKFYARERQSSYVRLPLWPLLLLGGAVLACAWWLFNLIAEGIRG
jgi:hypothetical protein